MENIGNFITTREELSLEWQIPDIFSFRRNSFLIGPDFRFCGACWSLTLWPNEDPFEGDSRMVIITFSRKDSGPPLTVHFTFGIRGSAGVEKKMEDEQEFLVEEDEEFVCDAHFCRFDFLSRSELKDHESRLMPDNILTITCDLKKGASGSVRGVEKLQESLRSMLMTGEGGDIVFKVRGHDFPGHRIILQARSTVFRAMFAHDMVEKQSGVVAIEDCDPQAFSVLLDHIYTGSSDQINTGNVLNVYRISDKYEMDTLKEQCVECIERSLSVASFCSVMVLALQHDDKGLTEFATQFFCDNSSSIVTTNDWRAFFQENSAVGYELLIKKAMTK